MRPRPEMTRRPGPPEDPQAHERMRAILDGHKDRIEASIASGPAGQEAGEVRGVPPAGKTPLVQLPMGYDPKADPPTLEWLTPVKGCQISSEGQYSVCARRSFGGWTFVAYRGLDVLGEPQVSAAGAREQCRSHYAKACGADNGSEKQT